MRKLHATIDNAITAASSDIESDDDEHSAIDLKNYDKLNSSSAYNSSRDSTNGNNRHHSHHHRSASHHRISESPYVNNSLTKCAKMTEEHGMIRNGSSINGVGSANACSTPSPPLPPPPTTSSSAAIAAAATTANNNKLPIVINSNGQTTGIGGRLQFFKRELYFFSIFPSPFYSNRSPSALHIFVVMSMQIQCMHCTFANTAECFVL